MQEAQQNSEIISEEDAIRLVGSKNKLDAMYRSERGEQVGGAFLLVRYAQGGEKVGQRFYLLVGNDDARRAVLTGSARAAIKVRAPLGGLRWAAITPAEANKRDWNPPTWDRPKPQLRG